jgi:hypothetical protein
MPAAAAAAAAAAALLLLLLLLRCCCAAAALLTGAVTASRLALSGWLAQGRPQEARREMYLYL